MASDQQSPPKTTSSTTTNTPDLTSKSIILHPMNGALKKTLEGPFQLNPFQYDGQKEGYEAKTVKEGLYVRLDMPGVEMENLKVVWEKKKVSFVGEAPKETENDSEERNYKGELDFSSGPVSIFQVKTHLKNGVLRMVLVGSGFQPGFSTTSSHFTSFDGFKVLETVNSDTFLILNRIFLEAPPAEVKGFYPFQVDGAAGILESKCIYENDSGFFYRIDMPDVPKEGFRFRFKNSLVFYGGEGVKNSKYDNTRRRYFGRFSLQCACCKVKNVQCEIKDGVVRMLIQKERIKTMMELLA